MPRQSSARRGRRPFRPMVERIEERVVPSFLAPVHYSSGELPSSVGVGDVNNDGILDLTVANSQSGNVSVLLGNGDGSFQSGRPFSTRRWSLSVAVGDVTGDGNLDLAVVGDYCEMSCFSSVSVLVGNGDGSFQTPREFDSGVQGADSVAFGEFNGDGRFDLAVTGAWCYPDCPRGGLTVLQGNGDGTFQQSLPVLDYWDLSFVAVADINADDRQDLIVDGPNLLLGNGDGTFQPPRSFPGGPSPSAVAVGDVSGDGVPDLAVANYRETGTVSVLLGNGDGTFQAPRSFPAGNLPRSVVVGDVNGDGRLDLVAANYRGNNVSVLLGNGDGTFEDPQQFATGTRPTSVATADLNGDGFPDLAVANRFSNNVSILLNDANWPGGPVAYFYVYPDSATVTAGQPIDLGVFALNASFSLVPEYTGEILFLTTDAQATTPGQYTFRPEDGGIALFPGGVTFRTPGQHFLLVIDTATFSVFGLATFDVQAPFGGGGAPGAVFDLFLTEALQGGRGPARR